MNDLICVSGELGGAFLGLTLLEREKRIFEETGAQPDLEGQSQIVGRLLKPEARKDIVEYFSEAAIVPTSMIDISDGLSSDILHICKASETGCVLYEDIDLSVEGNQIMGGRIVDIGHDFTTGKQDGVLKFGPIHIDTDPEDDYA